MSARLPLLLAGVAVGALSGVAAVVLHQSWGWLLLALLAAAATMHWAGPGAARVGFAVGWGVVVLRGALTRPEGDYLVPANDRGWALLVASFVLVLAALATARQRDAADRVRGGQPTPT